MSDTPVDTAIRANIALLNQGEQFLEDMPDEIYAEAEPPVFPSSIGTHLRHVLDHFDSLIAGLKSDFVDYHSRQRDPGTEKNPQRARTRVESLRENLLSSLSQSEQISSDLLLRVSSEDANHSIPTTATRELYFNVSHTIHHFGMIAMIARQKGWPVDDTFGIAPSTLVHRRSQQSQATQ